ncbi:hypothetical protein BC937DRAFT_90317 [Endogone sp. FLAS-F59071]|nr:hypothetical protein BC937DRAFT_90317 [Endogone sp. FLAS-F59071]|eukprot:RUS22114.1 hypothetical protein BC937DRAFT_90317 [Endogone sp. FLAS-F59071]
MAILGANFCKRLASRLVRISPTKKALRNEGICVCACDDSSWPIAGAARDTNVLGGRDVKLGTQEERSEDVALNRIVGDAGEHGEAVVMRQAKLGLGCRLKLVYFEQSQITNQIDETVKYIPFGIPVLPLVKLSVPTLSGPTTTPTSSATLARTESSTSPPSSTRPPSSVPSRWIWRPGISHATYNSSRI